MIKKITSVFILITALTGSAFASLSTPLITAPADGSIGNSANTTINWYNVTGASSYEFKINTDSTLAGAVIQATISSQYLNSQLLFGTFYYWQVRAIKTTGIPDSSAWSQIFSFETEDLLNIVSPTNGAQNQFPRTLLNWSSLDGVTNYEVQWDVSNLFNSTLSVDTLLPDSVSEVYTSNLKFGTTYYWRTRAFHNLDTTLWSTINSFTTVDSVSLSSPANQSTFQPTSVLLNWDYISGIVSYEIEIDENSAFNSSSLQTEILPDSISNWISGNLKFGMLYYWRVRAWHASDTTQWSNTWEFSTLDSLTLTAPVNAASNQFPNVTLNWNYISAPIFYDVEIDTTSSFTSPQYYYASNDTISEFQTSNLLFGAIYYWRARIHNAVDTSKWTSIWNFTTIDTVKPSYPAFGQTSIPVRLTLDWDPIEGTGAYLLKVDTLANFSSANSANFNPSSSSQQLLDLYYGTKYYWAVSAYHTLDTTAWSSNWEFTTVDAVSLTSPSDSSVNIAPRINLNWSNLTGSSAYIVEYDTTSDFSSAVSTASTELLSNKIITNLFFNQKYYWRVKALNLVDSSNWSPVWSFTTLNQLVHTSPNNGATGQPLLTEINWSGVSGAVGYIYRYDTSPLFTAFPQTGNSVGTNSRADINLPLYGQTYYWQVAVFDSVDTSGWSNPWAFTTIYQIVNAPFLLSPADLSIAIPNSNVMLNWSTVPSALGYEFEYSTSSAFTNSVVTNSNDTIGVINGLASYTTYYWRVRAANASGYSPWSTIFSFTTLNPFTSYPLLFAPEDLATDVPQPVAFAWNPLQLAATYECEYDEDSTFNSSILLSTSDTFAISFALDPLTRYYWRVRGIDANANSAWSEVWSFTTENPLTVAPSLYAPVDASINISSPANFSWFSIPLASSYECEYDTDSLFSSPITLLANDSSVISLPLNPMLRYFWRVRGVLGSIGSPWSTVWSFTTENPLTTAPVLFSPANLSVSVASPVTFSWFPQSAAVMYECQYDLDSLFSAPVILTSNDTEVVSLPLLSAVKYFWRVRGNLLNIYSPWSSVWSFNSSDGAIPIQIYPANNDTGLLTPVIFNWTNVSIATSYECQYDVDSLFSNPVILNSTLDTVRSQNLALNTKYFWRVRAKDGIQSYSWSATWKFTTSFFVGIASVFSENEFSLAPNPATDRIGINFLNKLNETVTLQLISSNGVLLESRKFYGKVNEFIDISKLPKGLYSVRIQTLSTSKSRKFVVN